MESFNWDRFETGSVYERFRQSLRQRGSNRIRRIRRGSKRIRNILDIRRIQVKFINSLGLH